MGQAGGCLGPVKNKDEIYVKLITQMHQQAQKITYSQQRNLDLYTAIKQKITKKGYLRKFIDNLSCHRQKILDSLNYNLKITTQKKQIQKHYAGLIIADSIMQMVYSPTTFSQLSAKDDLSDYDENNMSFFKKNAFKIKQISSDVPEYKLQMLEQYKVVYDEQYFKIITFLFDNQKKMYAKLLDSLIAFCSRHPGQIHCQSYLWKTIQKMNINIKKRSFLAQSCQLFSLLLSRTKDQLSEQLRNQQNLIVIIKTWSKQKQNDDEEGQQVQEYCKQIIETYFHRCLSSWDSLFIYECIFSIYDGMQFEVVQRQSLEKMYEQILKHSDFEKNFYRGLFNYLLGYMSITSQNYVDQLDRKWFSTTLGLSYQKIRSSYKSLLKEKVKIQCFKLLPKWIQKNYVNINEYCMYNSKALIFVYLQNSKHFYRNKGTTIMIMDEYFKVIKKMELENRRLYMERLFEEIRQEGLTTVQYQLLLKLIQQMVYNNILTQKPPAHDQYEPGQSSISGRMHSINPQQEQIDIYLTPILPKYSQQVKLELIKLLGYVAQSSRQFKLNEEGRVKLCQFLYSIYDNIVYGNIRKINTKARFKQSFIDRSAADKSKVNRYSGSNGLSITAEQLYTKYEFICAVISLFRIFLTQQEYIPTQTPIKPAQISREIGIQGEQKNQMKMQQNTNQNHEQPDLSEKQRQSQTKQYTNIYNVLKIYVQKVQEQLHNLTLKYSQNQSDVQYGNKVSREESNINIPTNTFKLAPELQYLVVYLEEQIKAMLITSNKQRVKNQTLVKMSTINHKLKPTINREQHLEQLLREINIFLDEYRQKKENIFFIQQKQIQQEEQYRSILGRYFSISNPATDPYKQFLSRPTLAQKSVRSDSDNLSTYTKQSSKYGGLVSQRCQKCKNLPQKCNECRDKDRRNYRHSDYSFMQVIDIVKV